MNNEINIWLNKDHLLVCVELVFYQTIVNYLKPFSRLESWAFCLKRANRLVTNKSTLA